MARRSQHSDPDGQMSSEDQSDLKIAKSRMNEPMGMPIESLAEKYGYKIDGRSQSPRRVQNQPVLTQRKARP